MSELSKKIRLLPGFIALGVVLSFGCVGVKNDHVAENNKSVQYLKHNSNLSTSAQENCRLAGGRAVFKRQLNGMKTPVCQFANGKRCREDAIRKGACID